MRRFFGTLYACLTRGGRAVLQIYPEDTAQAQALTSAAMRAGFSGGLVVDFPHSTRAKKYFLVLIVGGGSVPAARGLDGRDDENDDEREGVVSIAGAAATARPQAAEGRRRNRGALPRCSCAVVSHACIMPLCRGVLPGCLVMISDCSMPGSAQNKAE